MTGPLHDAARSPIQQIAEGLAEVYTAEGCAIWLLAPNKLLDGKSAAQVFIEEGPGRVLQLIEQMQTGAFV